MSDLLSKIKAKSDLKGAANVLQKAGLCTDSEIRSLTRGELHELFPGPEKLKLRRTIFEIINKPKPVHALVNELKAFIPDDFLGAAQTGNGVLAEYLVILKDLKTQLNQVQGFIDAHIDLLEGRNNDQLHKEHEKGPMQGTCTSDTSGSMVNHQTADYPQGAQGVTQPYRQTCYQGQGQESNLSRCDSLSGRGTSGAHGHVMSYNHQTGGPPQRPQTEEINRNYSGASERMTHNQGQRQESNPGRCGSSFSMPERKYQRKVTYQVVASGKTLDADKQLMNKVLTDPAQNQVQFVENHENHQITILFCPISSRTGTDVDAAFGHVKDDKPVILVVMYHEREPKFKYLRISPDKQHVVLHVDVFYHDSIKGLLTCEQNNTAASEIQKKLLEFSTPIGTSGNSQGAAVESGRSDLKTSAEPSKSYWQKWVGSRE